MELGGRRTHSTSAFKPSSVSRTTRDEVVRLPIYGRNSKEAVRAPLPATSWVHRAKQAVRKGGSSKDEPKASSVSPDARVSLGAHAHLASPIRLVLMFRPAVTITPINALAPKSWCPHPPGGHAWSRSLMSAWTLAPSFRSAVTFRLALMLTWCSCSTRCSRETAAAHTVHGPQELIPHGRNRAACMIPRPPTQNRAFAGKILTLYIPNRLIASRNACMERESCHR